MTLVLERPNDEMPQPIGEIMPEVLARLLEGTMPEPEPDGDWPGHTIDLGPVTEPDREGDQPELPLEPIGAPDPDQEVPLEPISEPGPDQPGPDQDGDEEPEFAPVPPVPAGPWHEPDDESEITENSPGQPDREGEPVPDLDYPDQDPGQDPEGPQDTVNSLSVAAMLGITKNNVHFSGSCDCLGTGPADLWSEPGDPMIRAMAAEVAQRAANTILDCGWLVGAYGCPEIGFCTMGALGYVMERDEIRSYHLDGLYREFHRAFFNVANARSIPMWNDELPLKSGKSTVVNTLRTVAEFLRK